MSENLRTLQLTDLEGILQFEQDLLQKDIEDPMEREFAGWHAPWRKESLEHYLPLGWSFGLFDKNAENILKAYFLAQPQLFTKGHTQSLWVEHLGYKDSVYEDQLVDIARRVCKDKHFQMLYVQRPEDVIEVKTGKF